MQKLLRVCLDAYTTETIKFTVKNNDLILSEPLHSTLPNCVSRHLILYLKECQDWDEGIYTISRSFYTAMPLKGKEGSSTIEWSTNSSLFDFPPNLFGTLAPFTPELCGTEEFLVDYSGGDDEGNYNTDFIKELKAKFPAQDLSLLESFIENLVGDFNGSPYREGTARIDLVTKSCVLEEIYNGSSETHYMTYSPFTFFPSYYCKSQTGVLGKINKLIVSHGELFVASNFAILGKLEGDFIKNNNAIATSSVNEEFIFTPTQHNLTQWDLPRTIESISAEVIQAALHASIFKHDVSHSLYVYPLLQEGTPLTAIKFNYDLTVEQAAPVDLNKRDLDWLDTQINQAKNGDVFACVNLYSEIARARLNLECTSLSRPQIAVC